MQNIHMLGLHHADQINLRLTFFVVAIFSFITIISYFNELAKAGLLKKQYGHYTAAKHREFRSVDHIAGNIPDIRDDKYEMENALIRNQGDTQQLRLDIKQVKKAVKKNSTDNSGAENKPINIAIRLGHNTSYVTLNHTKVKIYDHKNALPNYFLSLASNASFSHMLSSTHLSHDSVSITTHLTQFQASYHNATHVLLYQYEPIGYMLRTCLKKIAIQKKLSIPKVPLSKDNRKDWEMIPQEKKNSFQVLYGSMAFGVCESIHRPCLYFLLLQHPLDRILTIYSVCRHNSSQPSCHVNLLSNTSVTLRQFIKNQGNKLAQELMYFSRHCRLVGDDEVCLPDTKTSFILNSKERREHLKYIITKMEDWFSVVGIDSHIDDSIAMFNSVLGHNFTACMTSPHKNCSISSLFPGTNNISHAAKSLLQNEKMQEILYETLSLYLNDSQSDSVLEHSHLEKLFLSLNQSPTALHEIDQSERLPYLILREKLLSDPEVSKWISPDLTIYKKVEEIFFKQRDIFKKTQQLEQKLISQRKLPKKMGNKSQDLRHSVKRGENKPHMGFGNALPVSDIVDERSVKNASQHINHKSNSEKASHTRNKNLRGEIRKADHGGTSRQSHVREKFDGTLKFADTRMADDIRDHKGNGHHVKHSDYSWSRKKKVGKVLQEMVQQHQKAMQGELEEFTARVPAQVRQHNRHGALKDVHVKRRQG